MQDTSARHLSPSVQERLGVCWQMPPIRPQPR
jgi:hypothetical protein